LFLKCNYCDPIAKKVKCDENNPKNGKQIKSINTEMDDFIKGDKGKYYHTQCYINYLTKRKKSIIEIEEIIKERKIIHQSEIDEANKKDKFLRWIMEFYDGSLPSFYLKKLQSVRNGTHESINEPIDYVTLLDIYQYMANYLNKNAMKKNFEAVGQRMNYDLAVVIGNYGDYKRFKERQEKSSVEEAVIDKQLQQDNKLKQKQIKQEKEFDITDVIDDLLL
jgi:hypothetical protein